MLTDGLEQAIQDGIASFKTFAVGGSGVGTIPCPKNGFLVIVGIDYSYFSDAPVPEEGALPDFLTRSIFQVEFRSKKSQNHFIFRNEYAPIDVDGEVLYLPSGRVLVDTYLVHAENVKIDIVNVPSPDLWTGVNYSQLPTKSQEDPLPVGYGIGAAGVNAVRRIQFSATEDYLPLTRKRDDIAATNYREQFRVDVNEDNKLNAPLQTGNYGNFSYPIMNVQYVEFMVPKNQYVKGSN